MESSTMKGLKQDELDSKGKPIDYAGQDSCKQRFNLFIKTYLEGFFDDSGFLRWITTLLFCTLGSRNATATTIFAQHVLRLHWQYDNPKDPAAFSLNG